MDWFLLTLCGLAVFGARDACGLARFGDAKLLAAYALLMVVLASLLGALAEEVSREDAQRMLRNGLLWGPALAVHGCLWLAFQRAKRAHAASWPGWLFALPSPALLYSLGGVAWLVLLRSNLPGLAAGALAGALFVAIVLTAAWFDRSRLSGQASKSRALELGAAANLAAFLLIPLHQDSHDSGLLLQQVDWTATGIALGGSSLLVAASFLFHRMKRSRG